MSIFAGKTINGSLIWVWLCVHRLAHTSPKLGSPQPKSCPFEGPLVAHQDGPLTLSVDLRTWSPQNQQNHRHLAGPWGFCVMYHIEMRLEVYEDRGGLCGFAMLGFGETPLGLRVAARRLPRGFNKFGGSIFEASCKWWFFPRGCRCHFSLPCSSRDQSMWSLGA